MADWDDQQGSRWKEQHDCGTCDIKRMHGCIYTQDVWSTAADAICKLFLWIPYYHWSCERSLFFITKATVSNEGTVSTTVIF